MTKDRRAEEGDRVRRDEGDTGECERQRNGERYSLLQRESRRFTWKSFIFTIPSLVVQ